MVMPYPVSIAARGAATLAVSNPSDASIEHHPHHVMFARTAKLQRRCVIKAGAVTTGRARMKFDRDQRRRRAGGAISVMCGRPELPRGNFRRR
jgi:hypothetical protein